MILCLIGSYESKKNVWKVKWEKKRKERRVGTNKIIYALISHLGECDGAKMVCVGFTSVCSERCIAFLKTVFCSRKISLVWNPKSRFL